MAYIITGPTQIGTTGQLNTILGNVRFTDISTTQGNLFTVGGSGNVVAVATGTSGQVLTSNGAGTEPTFQTPAITSDEGFSATKVAGDTFSSTPTDVGNWSVADPGRYNTLGFDTTTGIYTSTNGGKLSIDATINFTNDSNSGERTLELVYNPGNVVVSTTTIQPTPNIAIANTIQISTTLNLAPADTLNLRFYSDGATGDILDTSEFSIQIV